MKTRRGPGFLRSVCLLASLLPAAACTAARPKADLTPRELWPGATAQSRREGAYRLLGEKRWNEAIVLLNTLIEADPSDMRLRMERGYARQAAGEPAAAADEFTLVARRPGPFQEQARGALEVLVAESSPTARAMSVDGLLDAGYDDLRKGGNSAARDKFSRALLADPGRDAVRKQLGYMSLAEGDPAAAAKEFASVHRLAPLDYRTALELGYVYDSLHDKAGAVRSFKAALPSPDPEVHDAAAAALSTLGGARGPFYADVYASPFYTSRFRNSVVNLEASVGYAPERFPAWALTLAGRWTRDSRSHGGEFPDVYSDNVLSVGPGLRFQPEGWGANLRAEYALAVNLLRTSEHPGASEGEARVIAADYRYWAGPWRLFADLGGSLGYYSRYRGNVIGELQARGGARVYDNGSTQLVLYAPLRALRDGNRDYYNNVWESGAGVELRPTGRVNLTLRAEALAGRYMGVEGRDPNPYGRSYRDTRVLLVYAAHFTREPVPPPVVRNPRRLYLW